MKFELRDSSIFEGDSKCCDIETVSKKEIRVKGKIPYNFSIKFTFSGYKIMENGRQIGRGKGLEVYLQTFSLKPEINKESIPNVLLSGKEVAIVDQNRYRVGYIGFKNNILVASVSSPYALGGVIYLAYLYVSLSRTLRYIENEGKLPQRPLAVVSSSKNRRISFYILVIFVLMAIFMASYSIIVSYVLLLLGFASDFLVRFFRKGGYYLAFYEDHLDLITLSKKAQTKIEVQYKEIKEVKKLKKGFIINLINPISEDNRVKNILVNRNPIVNKNLRLSNYLEERILRENG
ncbi:MAG: hypothetical protein G5Z42_02295 [Caldisphaeraceae archaeon]|nr:hypothetical protein [Caldisphaeraceae archaeon]MEB3691404.1 hypothetical protein [Caldisphaeraceae archaeon]MEB3797637.1 hypothetical protein [Caldisphaeraceae archaeon]